MPAPTTNSAFLDLLAKSRVVDSQLVDDALRGQPEFPNPKKLAIFLIKKGLLTKFQAEQILQGRVTLTLGKYKILDLIGRGGMGAVYLCEHITMRRRVALKVLPSSKANDPSVVERFLREARAVGALNHPNIVQAHDVDSVGKTHFLVMEYVEGINLHDLVRKSGPLAVERAACYIRESAQGLQSAFEAGLIHRDIKPANLLLSRQGGVKILDMGLARFFHDEKDNLTQKFDSAAVLGTVDYLAPEQSTDSHGVDIRADIYSLGATFYYLLTGRAPFAGGTMAQKLLSINMHEPTSIRELRPEVSEELAKVLARMMAKQLNDRFQKPAEVAAALAPWANKFQPNPDADFPTTTSKLLDGPATAVAGDANKTESITKTNSKLSGLITAGAEDTADAISSTQVLDPLPAPDEGKGGIKQQLGRHLRNRKVLAAVGAVAVCFLVLCFGGLFLYFSPSPGSGGGSGSMLAHFPLDGDVADTSGRGHRLFLNNGAFLALGRTSKALQFDGKSQYAATSNPVIDTRQPFSVAAWINCQDSNKNSQSILSQDGERMSGFVLQRRGDGQQFSLALYARDDPKAPVVRVDGGEPVLPNLWNHVVVVYTDSGLTSETPVPRDVVWIDDAPPLGADFPDARPLEFVAAPTHPVFSGSKSIKNTQTGLGQYYFEKASPGLDVGDGDMLFAHVYLDPKSPPRAIMLQFNDGSWEHRALWGEDIIPYGTGTGHAVMGPLPKPGTWARLEIDPNKVGLKPGGVINGWAFTQHDGTVYWDKAGIVTHRKPLSSPLQAKLYVNGRLRDTQAVERPWHANGPFILGAGKEDGSRAGYFHGQVGDVRVYGAALDDAAVLKLYQDSADLVAP